MKILLSPLGDGLEVANLFRLLGMPTDLRLGCGVGTYRLVLKTVAARSTGAVDVVLASDMEYKTFLAAQTIQTVVALQVRCNTDDRQVVGVGTFHETVPKFDNDAPFDYPRFGDTLPDDALVITAPHPYTVANQADVWVRAFRLPERIKRHGCAKRFVLYVWCSVFNITC